MEIFVLEDDQSFINLLDKYLGGEHELFKVNTIEEAKNALDKRGRFELFLLDENLEDGKGSDFCQRIRDVHGLDSYIYMMTKNSQISDKLNAYQLGVDDFIVKPIDFLELSSKIRNLENRINGEKQKNLSVGNLLLDYTQLECFLIEGNSKKRLSLTPKEFLIISFMLEKINNLVKRDDIISFVWGNDIHITTRTVDQHIYNLRNKIKDSSIKIQSIRSEGYKASLKE